MKRSQRKSRRWLQRPLLLPQALRFLWKKVQGWRVRERKEQVKVR
jgi:hypothetical protein